MSWKFSKKIQYTSSGKKRRLILGALFFLFCLPVFAQDLDQNVTLHVENATLEDALLLLEQKGDLRFSYSHDFIEKQPHVSLDAKNESLRDILFELFETLPAGYKVLEGQIVIRSLDKIAKDDQDWIIPREIRKLTQRFTLSGHLLDSETGEAIIGAHVKVEQHNAVATTNAYGYFVLILPPGRQQVEFSHMGYKQHTRDVELNRNISLNEHLTWGMENLEEVVINSEEQEAFPQGVDPKKISLLTRQTPTAAGSQEIIQEAISIPGISNKTEGSTGFHVRGGNHDQNLILIDEAPVYNEAHFLGFVSVFNWNTIKSATVHKEGIPAKYGGRLASVLDLRMKEGNLYKFNGTGELNTLYGQVSLEGPIQKEKSSFMLSARRSHAGQLLKGVIAEHLDISNFHFYDLNGKVNFKLGQKDRIYGSFYKGEDVLRMDNFEELSNRWGNTTGTLRWNHIYSPKVFSNTSLISSRYNFFSTEEFDSTAYYVAMHIQDLTLKHDFTHIPSNKHQLRYGVQLTQHAFAPGTDDQVNQEDATSVLNYTVNNSYESGIYFSDAWSPSERWDLTLGLRLSSFHNYGEGKTLVLDSTFQVQDSITRQSNGVYQEYWNLEPRIRLTFKPQPHQTFSFTADRTAQYVHLASNTILKSPTDFWLSSSPIIQPQRSTQGSLGYDIYFNEQKFQFTSAVYYKYMENVIDFKDGANLYLNRHLESEIRQGEGWSYGLEIYVRKDLEKFSASLAYTLSSTFFQVEGINQGFAYYAPYDKLHDLRLILQYKLNAHFSCNLNFDLASGLRTSLPNGSYEFQGDTYIVYGERNADRLPTYHRLDLSLDYKSDMEKKWLHEIRLGVYNVYNRQNAYALSFNYDDQSAFVHYLFPIMPSLSYRFSF